MTTTQFIDITTLQQVRSTPPILKDFSHHLCPGCGEGIAGRVIGEVLDELGLREQSVLITGNGCYDMVANNLDVDQNMALHGRSAAMASGIKRMLPDRLVFTMQGDGDLFSEGVSEAVHAASRGEKITIICMNNAVNGETGGQLTAATVLGQRTKTSLETRQLDYHGRPLKMAELLAGLEGVSFSARAAMHKPSEIQKAKKYLRKAFQSQLAGDGLTYVELLTMCPTGWFMDPVEALDYMENTITKTHQPGVVKDRTSVT